MQPGPVVVASVVVPAVVASVVCSSSAEVMERIFCKRSAPQKGSNNVDLPVSGKLLQKLAIPENTEIKKWKFSFFCQRHALSVSFDIFVVTF